MSNPSEHTNVLDIGKQQLGAIYANALLGATQKSGTTAVVLQEFRSLVVDVFDKLPDLEKTLASARVPHIGKVRILDRAFSDRMSEELLIFLKVVSGHGRLDCLREILDAANAKFNEMRGSLSVRLTSAVPVDSAMRQLVENTLQAALKSELELQCDTNPDLIGGMVIRVGDTVFDGSVSNRLERIRSQAMDGTFQAMIGGLDRFTYQET